MSAPTTTAKIPIHVSNGNAFVWSVQGAQCPLRVLSGLSLIERPSRCQRPPQSAPHVWRPCWHPPSGRPTEPFSGHASPPLAGRGSIAPRTGYENPPLSVNMLLTHSADLAYFVDDPGSHVSPTPHQLSMWNDTRKARLDASDRVDTTTKPTRLSSATLPSRNALRGRNGRVPPK
jgi:hypothetical protein